MKIWRPDLLIVFGTLGLGSLIYLITRTETTYLNYYISLVGDGKILTTLQGLISNEQIPSWIIYSLPDALWMLAMSVAVLAIWKFKIHLTSIAFTLLATAAGMMHETLQAFAIISGTFDLIDLTFICIAGFLPLTCTIIKSFILKSGFYHSIQTQHEFYKE